MKSKILKKDKLKNNNLKTINDIQATEQYSSTINDNILQNTNINIRPNETSQEFTQKKKKFETIKFNEFPGFFYKKFDLTVYKKKCDDSREKTKSPERIYKLNHKKGNGIPDDLIERLKYLNKIINDEKFQKYYEKRPKGKKISFEQVYNYIINYYKKNNELEGLLMVYYFICNGIKYYSKQVLEKMKEEYKEEPEDNIFLDKDYFSEKNNPSPEELYSKGIAISPNNLINFFEFFLKKLEIKYKHIDGYCKLMPKKNADKKMKKIKYKTLIRTQSAKNINEEMKQLSQTINHSWNAFFVRGEWYFCDCLFASGTIEPEEDNISKLNLKQLDINNNLYNYNNIITNNTKSSEPIDTFNFYYFMAPPEYLISTHRPNDDNWQFLYKTLSFKQFYTKRLVNYGEFYKNAYKYNVELLTHKNPFILLTTKDKLKIKLKIAEHLIEANLFYSYGNTKIAEVKYLYEESSDAYILEPIFPQKGEYILKINARAIKSTDLLYWPLIDYIIKVDTYFQISNINNLLSLKESQNKEKDKVEDILPKLSRSSSIGVFTPKIISDYSKVFPPKTFKKICYDNEDFRLIEPRSNYLKRGATIRFKVIVRGAVNVSILDGNHLTSLRRFEDGIFIGQKEIETNNVSLCCLRGKNVFTEIYKFKVLKEGRIVSSKPIIPRKRYFI